MVTLRFKRKREHEYKVDGCPVLFVDSSEKIERVQRMLYDATKVGVDTEYAGADLDKEHPFGRAELISLQFTCVGPKLKGVNEARYIFIPNWDQYTNTFRHFRKFLKDDNPKKVLHAMKNDAHVLANHGIMMRGLKADTHVKAALRNCSERLGLKPQAAMHLGKDTPDFADTFRIGKLKKNGEVGKAFYIPSLKDVVNGSLDDRWKGGGIKRLVEYAVKDTYYTVLLDEFYDKALGNMEWYRDQSMLDYYNKLDNPFVEALFKMERRGCLLNEIYLHDIRNRMTKRVTELEEEFFHICAKKGVSQEELSKLNLASNPQVSKLFAELGMDLPRTKPSRKHPEGQPSISEDSLARVRSARFRPLINALVEWRKLEQKLLGTYIEPWLEFVNDPKSDRMLRCEYRYPGPVTGRLSSAKPNLQNIPRPAEEGSDEGDPFQMRKAFVAPKGYVFGDADLSQIELRLMAHFSGDKKMLESINNGWDLHARTAFMCFPEIKEWAKGKEMGEGLLKEIKNNFKTQRQNAKTIGFMIAYGGGPLRYAEETGTSTAEGKRVIAELFRGYPGLKKSIDNTIAYCRKHGYIRTLLGRYLFIPDIHSRDKGLRAGAERKAFNYKIQGSAAELLKLSMILIDRDPALEMNDVTMRLQIHDELCFYIPKGKESEVSDTINDYMSNPYQYFGLKSLKVPTPGELGVGPTWLDAKAA